MRVLQILDVSAAPTLGMFTGHAGNSAVFERLNSRFADTAGVMFGSAQSFFSSKYDAFTSKIRELDKQAMEVFNAASAALFHPDTLIPINSMAMLENVPPCMHVPILTMPRMRELLNQGVIYGWGVDPTSLPEEDVVGRLLDNGTIYFNHPDKPNDLPMTFTIKSDDPVYDFDQLSILRETREFIDNTLEAQLKGDYLDITDLPSVMGKLRVSRKQK